MGHIQKARLACWELVLVRKWICKALKSQIYSPLHQGAWTSPEESCWRNRSMGKVATVNPPLQWQHLPHSNVCLQIHVFKSLLWVLKPQTTSLKTNHISWYCNTSMCRIFLTFQLFFWKLALFLWTLLGLEMMVGKRKRSLQRWIFISLLSSSDSDESPVCSAPRSGVDPYAS